MLGPSEGAVSGASWVSMKTAAIPSETAARAMTGANSALPAGGAALTPRLLHRMGGVHDDRVAGLHHLGKGAHVGNERVVAEADAALGQEKSCRCR